jgi:hypothetical protein
VEAMRNLGYSSHCPEYNKIADFHECHTQEKRVPETKWKLDVITVSSSIYNKHVVKMTKLHKNSNEEGRK